MKWRVFNLHPDGLTHREKFRDEQIVIKAGEFILMDYEDAVQFKGQYFPMKLDAQGIQARETYKVIKIEPENELQKPEARSIYVCHVDGKEFPSKAALEAYVEAKYGDLEPFKDEALDADLEKQAVAESVKKRPGRPPKEKTL